MRKFIIVWLGQLLSLMGSAMTRFVLAIWLWQQTGEATALVLVGVFTGIASLITNTIAGPVVDRLNRKQMIIGADLLVGLTTIVLLLLTFNGQLAAWHIYLMAALAGVFGTFHLLSFMASISLLIPKKHYTRANSLMTVADYGSAVGGPILAGLLLEPLGMSGVMLVDVVTFLFAVGTMLTITIPHVPEKRDKTEKGWRAATFGFRYIWQRPSLRGLLIVLFAFSLAESFGYPLITPMILARTGGDEVTLGVVISTLGIGGVIGGVIVTAWGGFRRKIHGVLAGLFLTGLLGDALMGLGQRLPFWLTAAMGLEIFIPLVISSNNAIWQSKVPPSQQGRVLAARNTFTILGQPLALLATGLLADNVFEPAMMPDGAWVDLLGGLVGSGAGAGMGLLLMACGLVCALASLWGYLVPAVREIETILPDHDEVEGDRTKLEVGG
jgi:MFS family permease